MAQALNAAETADLGEFFVRRALPIHVVAAGGLFVAGPGVTTKVGQALVGVGAAGTAMHYLDVARRVHALGRIERDFADAERFDVALFVCSARMHLMEVFPASRTRTALAALRALRYAAATGNSDVLEAASEALGDAMSACSARGLERLRKAVPEIAENVGRIDDVAARGSARTLLWTAFTDFPFAGRPEVAIQAANDYGELASAIWGRMVDGEEGQLATYVSMDVPNGDERDPVDGLLDQSRALLAVGLRDLIADTNRATADAWVRKLVNADALPVPLILESYADVMAATDDERYSAFRDVLAETGTSFDDALRMIGIDPVAERDDLGR